MAFVAVQIIASIAVLFFSWDMYCDKPLRVFVTVYILRLVMMAPINIYLHLAPRRRPTNTMNVSPRTSARAELSEAYALSERNRPVSFPPPVTTTNRHQYPALITPAVAVQPPNQTPPPVQPLDENAVRAWIDR
jgi:hypothetical protein